MEKIAEITLSGAFQDFQSGSLPPSSIKFEYSMILKGRYKYYAFVEGEKDIEFYANRKESYFNRNSTYYFCGSLKKGSTLGKKWVLSALQEMCSWSDKKDESCRWIFIIDKDYEPIHLHGLNVTKYHSVESYFFTTENLKTVFSRLHPEKFLEFTALADEFAKTYINYFLLCATVTKAHKEKWFYHTASVKQDDMTFLFIKKGGKVTFETSSAYKKEEQKMLKIIESGLYPEAEAYYSTLRNEYLPLPENIRGHNAFYFLKEYVKSQLCQDCTDARLYGFAKILNLGVEIVNSEGISI